MTKITKQQCLEFGQVAILIVLFLALRFKGTTWVTLAFALTLVTIIIPYAFYPFAILWFGLSKLLSRVMPAFIMAIIFFVVVTPVGLLRRALGFDKLKLKQYDKNSKSVMLVRNHTFTKQDLVNTF